MRLRVTAVGFLVAASLLRGVAADASDSGDPPEKAPPPQHETFAFHGELTYVEQETSGFRAPYSGPNSLSPNRGAETIDANIAIGSRLWPGAEGWISPEVDQGFGLDDTLGVAGFPSGEAYKIGKNKPYVRLQRLFIRDTLDLDGARETVDPDAFRLGGDRSVNRLVFTVGKISVTDLFDVNQYAHDPRADFLNWAAIDAGSFDYAADSWGYTAGAAVEWYEGDWTLRAGGFDLSDIPNSPDLEPAFHEFQMILELEHRHEIGGHPGKVMITAFDTRGRMGLLDQAVQLAQSTDTRVNIAARTPVPQPPRRRYKLPTGADLGPRTVCARRKSCWQRRSSTSSPTSIAPSRQECRSRAPHGAVKATPSGSRSSTTGSPPPASNTSMQAASASS